MSILPAYLALISYKVKRDRELLKKEVDGLDLKFVGSFHNKWTYGFVTYMEETEETFIVFGGSRACHHWFTNCRIHQTYYQGSYIHSGFLRSASVSYRLLRDKGWLGENITLVGHSLGGAIATAMVPLLFHKESSMPAMRLYRYGCPRVGDDNLNFYIETLIEKNRTYRNLFDMVPNLPLRGYEGNIGEEILSWKPLPPVRIHLMKTYFSAF